jgi:hypothetical protein
MTPPKLLIVYNADEGLFAALGDAVHKAVSPDTYPCSLCAITYGAVRMRPEWRRYLKSLPYEVRFYHRPDFHRAHPTLVRLPLPAILLDEGTGPRVLLDASTLEGVSDVGGMIAALDGALADLRPA